MNPSSFSPYETRIELRCQGGLLKIPDSVWHKSAHLCGAQIVSEYNGKGVKSYILSLSSLFIFDSTIVLLCCSESPFDLMLSYWKEALSKVVPLSLFIEKRLNPFDKDENCLTTFHRPVSPEVIGRFGFKYLAGDRSGPCALNTANSSGSGIDDKLEYLMYESWSQLGRRETLHHQVAIMFSPRRTLNYRVVEDSIAQLAGETVNQIYQFTPSGFSSNHLHCDSESVYGYSTIHFSESSYLSIESGTVVRNKRENPLPFHSLVKRITTEVQPKEVVIVPDWLKEASVTEIPLSNLG